MNAQPRNHAVVENQPSLREDCKLALVLGLLSALATAALFPYLLETMPAAFAKIPVSLPVLVVAQSAQAGILLTLLSLLGLRMGHRVHLGAPWLHALLRKQTAPKFPWALALLSGGAAGAAIVGLSLLVDPHLPAALHPGNANAHATSVLNGFLASFYGGICEELQLRLFLMTLIVWIIGRFRQWSIPNWGFWTAIIVSALLFGAGHLPAAAQVWPLTALVITRTILLNTLAGLVFGWLYWRRGFEVAMLGHFSADLVLHVLAPALSGSAA